MIPDLPHELQSLLADVHWEAVSEGESDASVYRLHDKTIRYLKVTSHSAQYPVRRDYQRLQWLSGKIAVPQILHYSETTDRQFLLMSDCAGLHPLHDDLNWTVEERIALLAKAAREFHALPLDDCPYHMSFDDHIALAQHNIEQGHVRVDRWDDENHGRSIQDLFREFVALKPDTEDWVVTHGDLYPVNIRVDEKTHRVTGYIDVGAMAVADRYMDLAPMVNAIGWHHGSNWIEHFFGAYGIPMDTQKLRFYQLYQEFL